MDIRAGAFFLLICYFQNVIHVNFFLKSMELEELNIHITYKRIQILLFATKYL